MMEGEKIMTIEELEKRLAAREARIRKQEKATQALEEENIKAQQERFLSLKDSIKTDMKLGQRVLKAGIGFPAGPNGSTKFVTDRYHHSFGFFVEGRIGDCIEDLVLRQIGWKNNKHRGDWDVMYYPEFNDSEIIFMNRARNEYGDVYPGTVEDFCNEYEKFHERFHKWLETIK